MEEIFALADRVTVLRDGESIATQDTKGMNESALIKLMVGREVSALYPPSETSAAGVALSLRGIGCKVSGVHDVNLHLGVGEVVGFAGIVGAGRTELARIMFGITPADTGTISLDGRHVSIQSPSEAVQRGIGYVPEDRRRHGVILEMPIATTQSEKDVKVVGLGLPNENKRYVHDGITTGVILWNTEDLGYLTVYAAKALADDTLKPGATSLNAVRLGTLEVKGDNVLLGKPFVFTKENIEQFNF